MLRLFLVPHTFSIRETVVGVLEGTSRTTHTLKNVWSQPVLVDAIRISEINKISIR